MKTIAIGITTTPERQTELNRCIESLRKVGIKEKIFVFAEPWKYKIKDRNVKLILNKERLGCFKNFDNMLTSLLDMGTDFVWTGQDDFVYCPGTKDRLDEVMRFEWLVGYYSFITRPRMEKHIYKNWWNEVPLWRFAWGMNYVFQSDAAKLLVKHPFYQNHLKTYTKNQQVDSCVSFVFKHMGLPMYYHNPSFCLHDGESTIGHIDRYGWELFSKRFPKTTIGIASIPNREKELQKTIQSLYYQADKIIVGLNNYNHTPEFLNRPGIEVVHWDNSLWDAMKFIKVHEADGFYFSCDDDLIYPKDYIVNMVEWIEKYDRKAVIGWHGVVVPPKKIETYYSNCFRYMYNEFLPTDNCVNVLGTGTVGFHTDTLKLDIKDFPKPNMADIWLGIKAQKNKVPMICVRHNKGIIQTMNTNDSIWEKKHNDDSDITEVVNSIKRWIRYIPQVLDE